MNNNIIVQISEGLGNQLFMYAHAYSLSTFVCGCMTPMGCIVAQMIPSTVCI